MPHLLRPLLSLGILAAATSTLPGQARPSRPSGPPTPAAVRRAAESIDSATYRARAAVIADDSMRGRDNPSPGLELTAAWVASEFRRIGLRPAGDDGTFIQRYRVRRSRIDSSSTVTATARGYATTWRLARDVAFLGGRPSTAAAPLPVVLLSGLPADPTRPFGDVAVRGAAVLNVLTREQFEGPAINPLIVQGLAAGVGTWIAVVEPPAPRWAAWLRRGLLVEQWDLIGARSAFDVGAAPVLAVRDSAAAALLAAAGTDLATLRAPAGQGIRVLDGVQLALDLRQVVVDEPSLPNVVGVLEGSDPRLREEAVAFVAHMDHVGVTATGRCAARGADSVCNGANDDASGTVGVVELAEAYASLRPRPARSLVFLVVSGEERGLFGSSYYTGHPAIPLERTVAAVAMDEIARNTPDTMIVIGKGFSSLGEVVDRVVGANPELGLLALDDLWPGQNYFTRSDHYAFARRGVPAFVLYGGTSAQTHRPDDSVDSADWGKAARIARVAFYVGLDVANAAARPTWDPEARARIVEGAGN